MARIPLPFGPGLDRATGAMAGRQGVLLDGRNVFAAEGKLAHLPTLQTTWFPTFSSESDIIGIFTILATKDIIIVTFDQATRNVVVWRINPITAPTLQSVGTWGTVNAASSYLPPRVVAAELNGRLYLAHEEPTITYRLATQVYTPNANDALVGAIANLTANLDNAGAAAVYFRAVATWNDSLWGTGFGSAADPDHPEIVRVSDPLTATFQPPALFYVGAVKDAVTALVPVGQILAVRKRTSGFRITGNAPGNYGIEPAESGHGCEHARLAVVTETGEAFVWDHSGPRRLLDDGSSVPAGDVLDLQGASPRGAVTGLDYGYSLPVKLDAARLRWGFGVYEYNERLVRFVFPAIDNAGNRGTDTGEFVLSRRQPDLRWTHGSFLGAQPLCAGNITTDKTLVPPAIAAAVVDQIVITPINDASGFTVTWRNPANLAGDEVLRVGVKRVGVETFYRYVALVPVVREPGVAQATQTAQVPYPVVFGDQYSFELSLIRPDEWGTVGSTATVLNQQVLPSAASLLGQWDAQWRRVAADRHEVTVLMYLAYQTYPARVVLQKAGSLSGPWTDVATYTNGEKIATYVAADSELGQTLYFRVSVRGSGPGTVEPQAGLGTFHDPAPCYIGPTDVPTLRDYGWRIGAPTTLDLFIDSPAGAATLLVQVDDATGYIDLYRGVPDPALLKILLAQQQPLSGGSLLCEDGTPLLDESPAILALEGQGLRMAVGFSQYGVLDYGPFVDVPLAAPANNVPNPVLTSTSFPASRTVRVVATGGGSFVAGERIVGYFQWPTAEGDGTEKYPATVVTAAATNTDTVLPDSARGQPVTYFYEAISQQVGSPATGRAVNPLGMQSVLVGVCP